MLQGNSFPNFLLEKVHDLSDYLGHINEVCATIDIKLGSSHYYFSVDRSREQSEDSYYRKKKSPSDSRRDYVRRNKYQGKKNSERTSVKVRSTFEKETPVSSSLPEINLLDCSFISDAPLPNEEDLDELPMNSPNSDKTHMKIDDVSDIEGDMKDEGDMNDESDMNDDLKVKYETDNASNIIEVADQNPQKIGVLIDHINNHGEDSLPQPVSPIKSLEQNFQTVKNLKIRLKIVKRFM